MWKRSKFLYKINWLIDSNFGRKPQKSCALISTFLIRPPPAANLLAPASFTSTSPIPGPLALAPADIPIYSMQPLA